MARVKSKRKKSEKWKKSEWFTIYAPKMFDEKEIGTTVADKEEHLIGRRVEVLLSEITGRPLHQTHKLIFKVNDVKGKKVFTEFDGFEMVREFLKRNVRRRRSMITAIEYYTTKDNNTVQITSVVFTSRKVRTSQKDTIRNIMKSILENQAKENTLADFVQKLLFGKIGSEIYKAAKSIAPINKVEMAKLEVIRR